MSGLLDGHIAVVTGAGSGIGRAIALGYAKAGANVVVLDVNAETAGQTATAITTAGGTACSYRLDVRLAEDCRSLAADIADTVGQVSILVNNAGINRRNAFTAEPAAVCKDWQDIMAINLNGVFNVTHAFLAQQRHTRGRIINIASI
jgi:NAD(P)-dependent dehydrogenase (short-subunit alcohol dehydrogenase family)